MLSVSSGTRRARISATRPPASATVRRTVPAIALVDRPDEDDADGLPVEPPVDELGVGGPREGVERLAAHVGRRRLLDGGVPLGAQLVDPGLEVRPLGVVHEAPPRQADAHEDPDHEGDEDGGERRDVVAQVEHGPQCRRGASSAQTVPDARASSTR